MLIHSVKWHYKGHGIHQPCQKWFKNIAERDEFIFFNKQDWEKFERTTDTGVYPLIGGWES